MGLEIVYEPTRRTVVRGYRSRLANFVEDRTRELLAEFDAPLIKAKDGANGALGEYLVFAKGD